MTTAKVYAHLFARTVQAWSGFAIMVTRTATRTVADYCGGVGEV